MLVAQQDHFQIFLIHALNARQEHIPLIFHQNAKCVKEIIYHKKVQINALNAQKELNHLMIILDAINVSQEVLKEN